MVEGGGGGGRFVEDGESLRFGDGCGMRRGRQILAAHRCSSPLLGFSTSQTGIQEANWPVSVESRAHTQCEDVMGVIWAGPIQSCTYNLTSTRVR